MTTTTTDTRINPWRIAGWSLLVALLAIPAVAMQFTGEVVWTPLDFVAAALMLGALGLAVEVVVRTPVALWVRVAMAAASVALFLLVWLELAVGIVGA